MALLEVRHLKKSIYKPVWNKPGGGVEGCDLFDGRRRVYGSDGRIRIRKTTLLNLLASFDRPTSGDIILNGLPFGRSRTRIWQSIGGRTSGLYSRISICWIRSQSGTTVFLPLVLAWGKDRRNAKNGCHLLSRCFGSPICWTNFRTKFPGVKNNGRRSQEHLLQSPSSFWRMNRPGLWIPGPPMNCCICLSRSIRRGRQSLW